MRNHKLLIGLDVANPVECKDSKSFLSMMVLMCRCILYPRCKLFVTSGGKEQAAGIVKDKVSEICQLIPAFAREIDWRRGRTQEGKDYCKYIFKSESYFDIVAASEKSRGKRRNGGLIEECVGVDGDILNEVLIPLMNIDRRCMDGSVHEEETVNKSQIYVTTAGWKNTFPYNKLITLLIRMVLEPEKAIVMGGTWRIPVVTGLVGKNWIQEIRQDETFNEASFGREYESHWSGTVEDAFFNGDSFDRCRKLLQPEYEASGRSSKGAYYVLSADVGRIDCQTVVCVLKVTPQASGPSLKALVNIYTMRDEHFEDQAIKLKKFYYAYKPKALVIDANGVGAGLVDFMVKPQIDVKTGDILPDFGVVNDDKGEYKKYRTDVTEYDAMYLIKANAPLNTEAHTNLQSQLRSGKMRFLIEEKVARGKLLATKKGAAMKPEERYEYLRPFTLTSVLKEELLNLREQSPDNVNIILKQANKSILKDKVSALEYGLYYIKQEEDNKKKKRNRKFADYMFLS